MSGETMKNYLLVEGQTDKLSIEGIVKIPTNANLVVQAAKGFSNLCELIPGAMSSQQARCVGIVFDANGDPETRWCSVREIVLNAYSRISVARQNKIDLEGKIPSDISNLASEGLWVQHYKPWIPDVKSHLGLWMMPDNGSVGSLEDFLTGIIISNAPCWEDAQDYIARIKAGAPLFPEHKTESAKIHAWRAVQKRPGDPPGQVFNHAIRKGIFDVRNQKAQCFTKWLDGIIINTT